MGGFEQPYIYEPARRTVYPQSTFNPRAVTQATEKAAKDAQKPKDKPTGPLINFNAHPDSYMIVAGQNVNYKAMPARTKTEVRVVRWVQFALRIIEEIAALGLLVCMICLRNMAVSLSWIMRIAPAWDSVITLYAIYHLARNPSARPPRSSASYHMFALFMDAGLLPFYVFIAFYANNFYWENPGTKGRWTSIFHDPNSTTMLLFVTFIGCAALGGLHILSAILDLWLAILYRKISKLPPDMNPLEDNLTGRAPRANKHKHKNSELTLVGSVTEKKPGFLSGSTVSVDQNSRLSTATKEGEDPNARPLPFQHSRMQSQSTFSPHNPESARWSRQNFEDVNLYAQSQSARSPRADVYGNSRNDSPSKHGSFVEYNDIPAPPSHSSESLNLRPTSFPVGRSGAHLGNPARSSYPALPNAAPSNAIVRSQQKQGLLNDNWISVDDDASDISSPSRHRTPVPIVQIQHQDSFERQPLKMNPPTPPPPGKDDFPDPDDEDDVPLRILQTKRNALTDRSDNGNGNGNLLGVQRMDTTASSVYSESAPSLKSSKATGATPKKKYYGDLAAATRGVRGIKSNDTLKSNGTVAAATMDSTGMMALGEYGFGAPSPPPGKMMRTAPPRYYGGGRVVSRTGADIADARQPQAPYPVVGDGFGMRERRDVSGKVAEEGRGGWFGRRVH